ncbi:EAL domain-containing protein [Sandarakinorhabdus sp.]|uniref:putative bifunctional diguanylate cyclase/phosphodiesterase n=1 Tax=Sandarakinorhabdus sp. TaxID=1916663 RepID=UPI00286D9D9F|nr:EAL domain-containing protein [Sandarakinorhabdus sp.]
MSRSPRLRRRSLGWLQVLGLGQSNDSFFAQVRGAQTALLNRHVPFNVPLLGLNVGAVLWAFGDAAPAGSLAPWLTGIAGLATLWVARNIIGRRRAPSAETSQGAFWQITAEVAAFALFWTGIVAALLPGLGTTDQALLILETMLLLGGTGFCTAVMPVAAILAALIIGVGSLIAVPAESALAGPMVSLAVGTYALLIARGALVTSYTMMDRMRSQIELGEQGEIVRLLLNEFEANGSDWLLETDPKGYLTHVTSRFADVARQPRAALLGRPLVDLVEGVAAPAALAALIGAVSGRRAFRDLAVPVKIEGEIRWWSLSGTPKNDPMGQFTGFRGVGRDVTEVRQGQERIAQLARFDPLTGLANRALFRETLEDAVSRAVRTRHDIALLFVDLDRFKMVNDSHGHDAGDQLLRMVGERLQSAVRGAATIARLGGDEFAILLADAQGDRAEKVAARIVRVLAQPFTLDTGHGNVHVQVGASVGYAMSPVDAATPQQLLKCADLALYEVKSAGRGAACRFHGAILSRAEDRRSLERDLAHAEGRGELVLAFQPVVEASDERIVGFEALLRWNHPERGIIPPLDFIPIAEETGLIIPIGRWVIDNACAWAIRWPEHIRIAVNVSPAQMGDTGLVDFVAATLARHGLAPERLELEITEHLFLADRADITATLAGLRALGVTFAIDDFGTGYSGLGYLHKAAFSRIKIDRSFVTRAAEPGSDAKAIIQAIVRLAGSLDMATTAEGTETRAEFEVIRGLGCGQVLGYLFGKPMPPEEATALVVKQKRLIAV